MAKFSDKRKGGRSYNVLVTDTKRGDTVGTFTVTSLDVRKARKAAIQAALVNVIDPSRLYAHAPQRA